MATIINLISTQFGAPLWLVWVGLIWIAVWKLMGMWKAARNKHIVWFIVLGVINTIGILPILYIYVFSKLHHSSFKNKKELIKKPVKKKVVKKKKK